MARLFEKWRKEIVPVMMEKFNLKNSLAVPRLEKIVVNMGVGRATENKNRLDAAAQDLALLTGQKAVVTRARKSVSGFKVREGNPIGCKVTLRGKRMYEFFDRLVNIVIPRIRDFRGLPRRSFDGSGNYSLGITEQVIFPEINIDKVEFVQGMDITIVVRNGSDAMSYELLSLLGVPFRR